MDAYFEKKISGFRVNFDLLDALVPDQEAASAYYAWLRDRYKSYFSAADSLDKCKFYIRHYRAKKQIYSSVQMLMEARSCLKNECVAAYYYLIYYALLQALHANVLLCPQYTNEKVLMLSHEGIKICFEEQFCKNKKCPVGQDVISFFEDLRSYREYYSYAKPFNLAKTAVVDPDRLDKYIMLCCQLFNLQCFVLWQEAAKLFPFDREHEAKLGEYMMASCCRLKTDTFTDDADANFWSEFRKFGGGDFLPLTISYDHDFDEYGTYDHQVYEAMGIPRTQHLISDALHYLYRAITR